ncbi:hypothetical protein O9992_07050 [Vibrio lentus]|nr:hypothetical protein [Vibrio lentus]
MFTLDPKLCVDRLAIQGLISHLLNYHQLLQKKQNRLRLVTSVKTPLPIVINRIALSDIKLNIFGS